MALEFLALHQFIPISPISSALHIGGKTFYLKKKLDGGRLNVK
jgi:hypothetical protein